MHPAVAAHVFAQILYACVHQFHCVQRTAPVLRITCRVCRDPMEPVKHLDAGIVGTGHHLVHIIGMPGERRIKPLPVPVPGEKRLRGAALFPRTPEEDHSPLPAGLFQIILHGKGCGKIPCAEHVVTAPVAGAALLQWLLIRNTRFLAHAGQRVEFSQESDHRSAVTEGAQKRRLDPSKPGFHRKAILAKHVDITLRRLIFLQAQLRILPHRSADAGKYAGVLIDIGNRVLLITL